MRKKVFIRTWGCQMNFHDAEKMFGVLLRSGYRQTESAQKADLIILNTCSIRQKAEQKFFSELGRLKSLKKKRADLKIAVAGCIAQQEGKDLFKKAPYVDFIFGPQNIHHLHHIGAKTSQFCALEDNPSLALSDLPSARNDDIHAWVTIMYGCNNFCTYCVVPFTRGRERSRPSENICAEVSELAERGCKEITLLGQNVNSYESDVDFAGLLEKLDAIREIKRIRFVTSHPKDLSDRLISAIADLSGICEHIHLPLQSASDSVLKRMKRGYALKDYVQRIDRLRRVVPNIAITSDVIAGFPGESDNDHAKTVRALEDIRFDGIFAFAFSARRQTRAARYEGQIPADVKMRRLEEILQIQDSITLEKNRALEGTVQEILVEGFSETDKRKTMGRTRTNKIVTLESRQLPKGSFIRAEIVRARKHSLEGVLVS